MPQKSEKILITAALPYANGPLHLGHLAGAYLPADVYARFERLRGSDVLYICGSDEYGIAITLSAEIAHRNPQEHVDLYHQMSREFFAKLNISFDHYSRTTWQGHRETTTAFFRDLLEAGYIEDKVTEQLYSETDHRFLSDRYVVGTCPKCRFEAARGDECPQCGASFEATDLIAPRSKVTGSPLTLKKTRHWFLRFDLFKKQLTAWLGKKNWRPNVKKFAQNYIDDLKPRAITRDSDWGIPVPLPEAAGKVFYVWFDAPIGYISATREWALKTGQNPDAWKEYWLDQKTTLVQFIGKDNIPFHAIFFPAMIMGQKTPYKLVDQLPANEFYHLEGKPFSKSAHWFIDLDDFFSCFSADQVRYAIAANAPESHDSSFCYRDFQSRCNAELLGKYGNLVNRVLVFVQTHCDGKVPPLTHLDAEDSTFLHQIEALVKKCSSAYEHFQLRKAASYVMELAAASNGYFDRKKPWRGAKDPTLAEAMGTTIGCCLKALALLALTSYPIIPETAEKVWLMLGQQKPLSTARWQEVLDLTLPAKRPLPKPTILFHKVEDEVITAKINALQEKQPTLAASPPLKEEIAFDLVEKLDLRVGKIIAAELVPKSSKLLKVTVDLGFETRTIVSGIAKSYPDLRVLIGKKVAVVANLKPAKLMGIESQGMLLTAGEMPPFALIEPEAPLGSPIA
ncbi:MAG: methionine--tRNA ligase [Chlamydiota bacterium]